MTGRHPGPIVGIDHCHGHATIPADNISCRHWNLPLAAVGDLARNTTEARVLLLQMIRQRDRQPIRGRDLERPIDEQRHGKGLQFGSFGVVRRPGPDRNLARAQLADLPVEAAQGLQRPDAEITPDAAIEAEDQGPLLDQVDERPIAAMHVGQPEGRCEISRAHGMGGGVSSACKPLVRLAVSQPLGALVRSKNCHADVPPPATVPERLAARGPGTKPAEREL